MRLHCELFVSSHRLWAVPILRNYEANQFFCTILYTIYKMVDMSYPAKALYKGVKVVFFYITTLYIQVNLRVHHMSYPAKALYKGVKVVFFLHNHTIYTGKFTRPSESRRQARSPIVPSAWAHFGQGWSPIRQPLRAFQRRMCSRKWGRPTRFFQRDPSFRPL